VLSVSGEPRVRLFRWLAAAFCAAGCLVLAGCGGGSRSSPDELESGSFRVVEHPAAGKFKPDSTSLSGCGQKDFDCWEQAFGNIAFRDGPGVALSLVSRLLARNVPAVRGDCHTITHWVGSATLVRFKGNAGEAIGAGNSICGSGYYHGLTEYALGSATNEKALTRRVVALCSDRKALPTEFLSYQCLHGLGHGLMNYSVNNLPWALSMCSKLEGEWSQRSCSGGVFMQNFNPPDKLSPFRSRYVRDDDLLYPCTVVETKYKFYCYLQITEHILHATRNSWIKTVLTCEKAPKPWDAFCFQSYGRDAAGHSRYEPRKAYRYCVFADTHFADCIYGVVRDFVNNDGNGTRAAQFCRQSRQDLRGFCFYGLGTILRTLGHDPAWVAQTCRSLSVSHASECEGRLSEQDQRLVTPIPED